MYPSSSPIAKTLLPLVANEPQMTEQLSRRLRAAAEKMQRTGLEYKDLVAKQSAPEPMPLVMFYRTNRDGSVVTLDSAGRVVSLESSGKKIYSYVYKNGKDNEPARIEFADGTVLEKHIDFDFSSVSRAMWVMKPKSIADENLEFRNATLIVRKDGSFSIKYKCQIASSITREDVLREISYNARGRRVTEFVKSVATRIGPGNSVVFKEIYVRRAHREERLV